MERRAFAGDVTAGDLSRRVALPVFAAIGTAWLAAVSWGKWSDALIDSGREWIVPDAIARGGLLYRDVVYWFGPFTPYLHALFFRAFGSSFGTLAFAGACGAAAVLACLYMALSRVTGRREAWAWTAIAVPLLVFMPNAGGAILGMGYRMWHAAGFALLAIALACGTGAAPRRRELLAAGALAGLAGLCRTEWGIAAVIAASVAALVTSRASGAPFASAAFVGAGFLAVESVGIGLFVVLAGAVPILRDGPVLLLHLPPEITARVGAAGAVEWMRGSAQMAYSALLLVAVFFAIEILVAARSEPGLVRPRLLRLFLVLLLLIACAAVGGTPAGPLFSGAPLICAVSVLAGLRTRSQPLGAALAGFGTMGVLASHRRFFFLTDGPYVAPPLLFALVSAAGCTTLWISGCSPAVRRRLSAGLFAAVTVMAAAAFAIRIAGYRADDRVPVPGTQGMLSAQPAVAREIAAVSESIRRQTSPGSGLVVFPEGEVINYLSDRRNPIRHKLYLPGYVTAANELAILKELERADPAAVVVWPRPLGEYGKGFFGRDYGMRLRAWIDGRYRVEPLVTGPGPPSRLLLGLPNRN